MATLNGLCGDPCDEPLACIHYITESVTSRQLASAGNCFTPMNVAAGAIRSGGWCKAAKAFDAWRCVVGGPRVQQYWRIH